MRFIQGAKWGTLVHLNTHPIHVSFETVHFSQPRALGHCRFIEGIITWTFSHKTNLEIDKILNTCWKCKTQFIFYNAEHARMHCVWFYPWRVGKKNIGKKAVPSLKHSFCFSVPDLEKKNQYFTTAAYSQFRRVRYFEV